MKKNGLLVILLIATCILTVSTTQVLAQEKDSISKDLSEWREKFEKKCPDVVSSFYNLHDIIVTKEGKLTIKEKEFIAIGIALSKGCKSCIYFHTARALENGATEEEILEAASVAIYMGGGPAFSQIKYVIDALEKHSDMKESKNAEK